MAGTYLKPIVVVKIGSSSITDPAGGISETILSELVEGLVNLRAAGVRPILVTSGAIAAGRGAMAGLHSTEDLAGMQALAAVGQSALMAMYSRLFAERDIQVGQLLLAAGDFGERTAYLNVRATIDRLLSWAAIPIINENDTTATDEITLGDNDRLSALVAGLIAARMLIILTDTAGVLEEDPRFNREAALIQEVREIDDALERVAGGPGRIGTGGMATKLAAARIATWSGVPCVIAHALEREVMIRAWKGESVGTRVRPRTKPLPARKVWIAFARRPAGTVGIDAGAARALARDGRSLLSVGVTGINGTFVAGDVVDALGQSARPAARGIVRVSSDDLRPAAAGMETERSGTVVIHRDDMIVFDESAGNR